MLGCPNYNNVKKLSDISNPSYLNIHIIAINAQVYREKCYFFSFDSKIYNNFENRSKAIVENPVV